MRINTNLSALNAYRNLNMTDSRLSKSLERLSSGLRINRAADDAAGLAISEKMRGQIRGLNQATRNAQDGISLMQTAEGALNETHSILQRMRELAVQAASDTLTSSDRIEIQREIDQLKSEIDRIASSTEFNTKKLLDGSSAALTSTSDMNTKVFMRGGLRTVDQFGQKAVGGGNYKLEIEAATGSMGEVQKTDIMKVKHESDNAEVGDIASGSIAIKDIDRFWDANGNFLVQDPQTINLVGGDGKSTSITIFGSDTINDIETKLNDAIHNGLEQKDFNTASGAYVQFVNEGEATTSGHFSVAGTFVIQSAVTGKDGEIRFSGNEGIINALSLTTLQKSVDNEFTVTVTDAHDQTKVIAQNVRIVGNMLVGVIHENVDVKFDPMAGLDVTTTGANNQFTWTPAGTPTEIFVHLSDNTMVFHIGANPLQDVAAAIGDMSSDALGIDNILVTNRDSANRALNQIDYAIEKVSTERAKLGAVQNRLEHTINNLTVAAENLTAAESRVRDLDFAMEMVEFTRNQIMTQAGTSMLAQANQKPQSVLMLLQ